MNDGSENPPRRDANEPQLYAYRPEMAGSITANRRLFEFRPFGRRSTNGTVTFLRPSRRRSGGGRSSSASPARPRVTRTALACGP